MRFLNYSSFLIFLLLQISLQIDDDALYIDSDFKNFVHGSAVDGSLEIAKNIETFLITKIENPDESEEELNNEETELLFSEEGEIVASADDCIPVTVEKYQKNQPKKECEVINGVKVCAVTIVVLDCQSTRRCASTFVPRIGFNCVCKEEITCTPMT